MHEQRAAHAAKQPKTPRRPRLHHDPKLAKPYPPEKIAHCWELLEALDQRRVLMSHQLRNWFFLAETPLRPEPKPATKGDPRNLSPEQRRIEAAQKRTNEALIRLKDRGWLERLPIFLHKHAPVGALVVDRKEANIITLAGARALTDHLAKTDGEDYQPRYQAGTRKLAYTTLSHLVAINDAIVALDATAGSHGIALPLIYDDSQIAKLDDANFTAPNEADPEGPWHRFTPDALVFAQTEGLTRPLLLEIDRDTEGAESQALNSWATKIAKYAAYGRHWYGQPGATDPFFKGMLQPLVLTVVPNLRRLERLKKVTEDAGCRGGYLFTVRAWMDPTVKDPFADPIWQRASMDGWHVLNDFLFPAERRD